MKKKTLITGATGFIGSHLIDYILENHPEVELHGTTRYRTKMDNVRHIKDKIVWHNCDYRDAHNVDALIKKIRPDKIFHLAAQSYVLSSWNYPTETITNNIVCELNVFEAVRKYCPDCVIIIAGSSEEYGQPQTETYWDDTEPVGIPKERYKMPIKEDFPLNPLSPYAVSKVGQDKLAYQYFKSYGLKIVRTRFFNTVGTRRGDVFICSTFAKQIARIEKNFQEPLIRVGNLESKRDFTDVRDMVGGIWLASEKCEYGESYNICSNNCYSGQEVLDILLTLSGVTAKVVQDPERMRPSDLPILRGDNTKFCKVTKWKPRIKFTRSLSDLLEYWREIIGGIK